MYSRLGSVLDCSCFYYVLFLSVFLPILGSVLDCSCFYYVLFLSVFLPILGPNVFLHFAGMAPDLPDIRSGRKPTVRYEKNPDYPFGCPVHLCSLVHSPGTVQCTMQCVLSSTFFLSQHSLVFIVYILCSVYTCTVYCI